MQLYKLEDLPENLRAGGKAEGLRRLREFGCNIPATMLLTGLDDLSGIDEVFADIKNYFGSKAIAVRSSASLEDSPGLSFAGFFKTYLHIHSAEGFSDALHGSLLALQSPNLREYLRSAGETAAITMNLVIQEMIDTGSAGIVFTADASFGRRDKIQLSVYQGYGDEFTQGKAEGKFVEIFKTSGNPNVQIPEKLLTKPQVLALISTAKSAEKKWGTPLDMEWVKDKEGVIWWLQARPITTLFDVHLNELDSVSSDEHATWTTGGIGEAIPGCITPLALSVLRNAAETGLKDFALRSGIPEKTVQGHEYTGVFYNRLFLNLTHLQDFPKHVLISRKSNLEFYTLGRVLPGEEPQPEALFWRRAMNTLRQFYYFYSAAQRIVKLELMSARLEIAKTDDPLLFYERVDAAVNSYCEAFKHYYAIVSSASTSHYILRVLLENHEFPDVRQLSKVTTLLSDIPGIDSIEPIKDLEILARMIHENENLKNGFVQATPEDAWFMLNKLAPEEIRRRFQKFMGKHGHRSTHEMDFRELSWKDEPLPVIRLLQKVTREIQSLHLDNREYKLKRKKILAQHNFIKQAVIRNVAAWARKDIKRLENAKSLIVKMESRLKDAYRQLSIMLVNSGLLQSEELIYFLQHAEIQKLIEQKEARYWNAKAASRNKQFSQLQALSFDDLYHGNPYPREEKSIVKELPLFSISGLPVSGGLVKGKIRKVQTPEDAAALRPGEIMITSFSDNSFSGYFGVIGGLISEVGHPLSHGAIIAREYGLPAIVSVRNAFAYFENGDEVILDGDKGVIEKLS